MENNTQAMKRLSRKQDVIRKYLNKAEEKNFGKIDELKPDDDVDMDE